ncbi:MAG: T9SS type A sorting domain-containing protein [Flavobacteriales bacterium]|nr:T9SS type A sorting domain-containing protein [Flavobacteriales bacterium]
MRTLLTAMACIIVIAATAQLSLSNQEIYDFEIGDVFHYESYVYNGGTADGKHHIQSYLKVIGKTVTSNVVTYKFHRYAIDHYSGSSMTDPSYTDTSVTYPEISYVLNATYFDTTLCDSSSTSFEPWCFGPSTFPQIGHQVDVYCATFDTLGVDSVFNYRQFYVGCSVSSNCFETQGTQQKFVEGLGRTNYWYSDYDPGIGQGYSSIENLVYYSKTNGETWGSPLPLSISENKASYIESLSLYPNPAKDFIKIQGEYAKPKDLTIYNQMGQVVFAKQEARNSIQVDVSNWSNGHYYVQIKSQNQLKHLKFVKN